MTPFKACPRCYGMFPDMPDEWASNGYCVVCDKSYMRTYGDMVKQQRRGANKVFLASRKSLSLEGYVDLRRALAHMPLRARDVLLLWAAGYTLVEIAAKLDISDSRVQQLMYEYAPTWRDYHPFAGHVVTEKMRQAGREAGKRYSSVAHAARWRKYHPLETAP